MSPEFESILGQRGQLAEFMDGMFLFSIIASAIAGILLRPRWRVVLLIALLAITGMTLADNRFQQWWADLLAAERTDADWKWIADHDGGRLIVYFRILVGGALSLVAGLCSMGIGAGIRAALKKFITRKPSIRTEN